MAISPKLPLNRDWTFGYRMNHSIRDVVKQNLTNILMTVPGERIMNPEFGVGLQKYLFEQMGSVVDAHVEGKIRGQVRTYMGFLKINTVTLGESADISNLIFVSIDYTVPSLNLTDQLSLEITI